MEIKPVGNHLEAVCSGCGEALLIGNGDSVNFRPGKTVEVGGVELPIPEAVLCSVCSRKEFRGEQTTIKFLVMVCSRCGADLSDCDSPPEFELGEGGEWKGVLCSDCSEPWRMGECDET